MVAAAQKHGRVIMRRLVVSLSVVVVLLVGVIVTLGRGATAQEATPDTSAMMAMATHPFVGTWIVDTLSESETDSPEIAIVTGDGRVAGLGANRVAGGTWEVAGPRTADLTLVTVFDNADGAGYAVIRGAHEVDETGDAWTCECTFTVVGADGTVLASGVAPASARRLPLEGVELVGTPLAGLASWTPAALATPTP
jgi:hypothetical protein